MKATVALCVGALLVCMLVSCGTQRRALRADDPYLYKRGPWNVSKGGILDDIPQFLWQMIESMFDFGAQPIDPPSIYEPVPVIEETVESTVTTIGPEVVPLP
ncbi:MAG: hypothetical protein PHN82_12295 [bacterium]|nr:hypothetical protein [bacterium]